MKLLEATGNVRELDLGVATMGQASDPKLRGVFRVWYDPDPGEVVLAEGRPVQRNVKVECNLTREQWKLLKAKRAEGAKVRVTVEVVDGE